MGRLSFRIRSVSACAVATWMLVGCGSGSGGGSATGGTGAAGSPGAAGASAAAGQSGGSAGATGTAGATGGPGGSTAGTSGAAAGTNGATAGTSGAAAGTSGATAGASGAAAGASGAAAGTSGAAAGTSGAAAGSGGTTTGAGGAKPGTGGSTGVAGASGTGGVPGTGGAGGAVVTPASADALCALFCSRLSTCDTARDQQTCLYSCRDSNSALFPNLRTDLVAGITACVESDDCATLDQSTSLGTCVTQASAALAPSAAGSAFCTALGTADTQCGISLSQTNCLNSIKLYSDATIAQAMVCATKSCSLIYSCASATLGQATGSWALGGGIQPGQECSGTSYPCSYFYDQPSCQAAGCTYSASCAGTPYCDYEYSSSTCATVAGCTWNSSSSVCGGTPTASCASMGSSITTCEDYTGCYYNQECSGTTAACSTLTVNTCTSHAGCSVVDAM
jgi:hypothetical protein